MVLGGIGAGAVPWPWTIATASIPPPGVGSDSAVSGGLYPGSTSRAAYSVPRWTWPFHLESSSIFVNGWSTTGCTHHSSSLLVYNTICWPGRTPIVRPSIVSSLLWSPSSAIGTRVNVILGAELVDHRAQASNRRSKASGNALLHASTALVRRNIEVSFANQIQTIAKSDREHAILNPVAEAQVHLWH